MPLSIGPQILSSTPGALLSAALTKFPLKNRPTSRPAKVGVNTHLFQGTYHFGHASSVDILGDLQESESEVTDEGDVEDVPTAVSKIDQYSLSIAIIDDVYTVFAQWSKEQWSEAITEEIQRGHKICNESRYVEILGDALYTPGWTARCEC